MAGIKESGTHYVLCADNCLMLLGGLNPRQISQVFRTKEATITKDSQATNKKYESMAASSYSG